MSKPNFKAIDQFLLEDSDCSNDEIDIDKIGAGSEATRMQKYNSVK